MLRLHALSSLVALVVLAPLVEARARVRADGETPIAAEAVSPREVRVLEVKGSPRARGVAHGELLKEQIHELIAAFEQDIEATYGVDAAVFRERFLAETDFVPAIEKWTPGLLDEVRGIAEGAELEFERVYLFQLADEIWSMGRWALRDKCTAVAVGPRGEQPAIVAQNMDIPGFYQRYPTLLRVLDEERPRQLLLTCPGLIGVNGMNSKSVAIACNTLLQLAPSREGLPCLFVVRGALRHESLEAAEAWLREIPHAVGQNYTLGDPDGVRAFECSSGSKEMFAPFAGADFTYHTNHPLVNADWHPDYVVRCDERSVAPKDGLRKCWRIQALEERFGPDAEITPKSIRAALASRDHARGPICGDWTYGCTLFLLAPDDPRMELSPGRPDRVAFQVFRP